jgi:hypothetical protein
MTTKNSDNSWASNIDAAMNEIERPKSANRGVNLSFDLPGWLPWALIAVLLLALGRQVPLYNSPHSAERDYQLGGRTALLMIAEDIEWYRLQNGSLPEEQPSAIGAALGVHYQRVGSQAFELRMASAAGELVFAADSGSMTVKPR